MTSLIATTCGCFVSMAARSTKMNGGLSRGARSLHSPTKSSTAIGTPIGMNSTGAAEMRRTEVHSRAEVAGAGMLKHPNRELDTRMTLTGRIKAIPPPAHRRLESRASRDPCRVRLSICAAHTAARSCAAMRNRIPLASRSSAAAAAHFSLSPSARRPPSRASVPLKEMFVVASRSSDLNGDQLWYLSLCAGYGGLDLGVHIAEERARAVGYVERDAHAAATLVARMDDAALGDAPVWDDVKSFDGRPWRGVVDLLIAGYPCQPFSRSGKQRGAADPRHLWPDVARIIREARPRAVFVENVEGHIDLGLAEVATSFAAMGYHAKAGLFSAAEAGAPHWRKRLFILAYANRTDGRQSTAASHRRARCAHGSGTRRRLTDRIEGRGHDLFRNGDGAARARRVADRRDVGRYAGVPLFPPAPGRLPAWGRTLAQRPELEPAVLRMADGMADRMDRLHGAGNGVCPLAAARAYRVLKADFGVAC